MRAATDGWANLDIQPGNVVAWPTNLGWMMGPWLIFASLLAGATVAVFEVRTPALGITWLQLKHNLASQWPGPPARAGQLALAEFCPFSTLAPLSQS